MTDDSSRECGGEVNQSSSMSNPDPSRAALADAVKVIRAEPCPFKDGPMADGWAEAWATFLNRLEDADGTNELYANSIPLPGRLDCGELPSIPDDDSDFTPELARKIIAKYQEIIKANSHDASKMVPEAVISDGSQGPDTEMQGRLPRDANISTALPPTLNSGADRCPHDMGFDNELGPLGCLLVSKELQCVCEYMHFAALPRAVEGGAVADIAAERHRQVSVEGWTLEHDDAHGDREKAIAAACYALAPSMVRIEREWVPPDRPSNWLWHFSWWKPGFQRQNLIKAGALIVAEIERLDRASARRQP